MQASHAADKYGQGCPYCANKKRCPLPANCQVCFTKSFAAFDPEKTACWSQKNTLAPSQCAVSSNKKFFFDCDKCKKEFTCTPNLVTGAQAQWCPHCHRYRNKSMKKLCESLDGVERIRYLPEVPVQCNGRSLRWDLVVTTRHGVIHIESDGPQHFTLEGMIGVRRGKEEGAFECFKTQRENDLLKDEHIRANNGLLFRFSYRQRHLIPELVQRMLREVEADNKGVIYLDTLYDNWGPIKKEDIVCI